MTEAAEDGFEISSRNTSVVSIGSFHAKQSSQYQSFNIHNPHFTQLSTYTPAANQHVINSDIEQQERIQTMKELCQMQRNRHHLIHAQYDTTSSDEQETSYSDADNNDYYNQIVVETSP